MKGLLAIAVATTLLVASIDAHMVALCAVTSPNACGEATFFVGNWHSYTPGFTASGAAYLQTPSGTIHTFNFTAPNQCVATSPQVYTTPNITEIRTTLFDTSASNARPCTTLTDSNGGFLLDASDPDTIVECYRADANGDIQRISTDAQGVASCETTGGLYSWYVLPIENVGSGQYKYWALNVDAVNSPYGIQPCQSTSTTATIAETQKAIFDLQVPSCGGTPCTNPPPGPYPNVDPTSLLNCQASTANPLFNGFICPAQCLPDTPTTTYTPIGQLQCVNGVWTNFQCTDSSICLLPNTANNNNGNIDPTIIGVQGDGCGFNTAAGTPCDPTCPSGLVGVGQITCESDGTWSGDGMCVSATPTPTPNTCEDDDSSLTCDMLSGSLDLDCTQVVSYDALGAPVTLFDICPTACGCCDDGTGNCICNNDMYISYFFGQVGVTSCRHFLALSWVSCDGCFAKFLQKFCPCACGGKPLPSSSPAPVPSSSSSPARSPAPSSSNSPARSPAPSSSNSPAPSPVTPGGSCQDYLVSGLTIYGLSPATGFDLRGVAPNYAFLGCAGSSFSTICSESSFYCRDTSTGMQFGTTAASDHLISTLGPSFVTTAMSCGSTSQPEAVLWGPNTAADANALCQQLGFSSGNLLRSVSNSNPCDVPFWDGSASQWWSNFVNSSPANGGAEYECFF